METQWNNPTVFAAQRHLDILHERGESGDDDLSLENSLEDEEARPRKTVAR